MAKGIKKPAQGNIKGKGTKVVQKPVQTTKSHGGPNKGCSK